MSSDDVILRVSNVSKCFEIYSKPVHRLFQTLTAGYKKFYREFWALKDVSFEVKKGECIGIIGRNGAGKSTLLQIITGILQPTSGSVELHGKIAALLELGSGFNPEFTGRENVYINAAIYGLTREETNERLPQILEFADIGDFIDQPVKVYSSGMMVRLAFAIIAHVDANVMIVDEALAVGDAFFQQKCMRFMRQFMKNNTVIFVSHDTGAVTGFCTRGILLEHGKVKMISDPKEVSAQYLKDLYAEQQDISGSMSVSQTKEQEEEDSLFYRDMRTDWYNTRGNRNDIEIFQFNPDNSFGQGGAYIEKVLLCDNRNNPLSWIVGGEMVKLVVTAVAKQDLYRPILGFLFRDHLGQDLFGDNTYVTYREQEIACPAGQKLQAEFVFRMPYLAPGDYAVTVAIAEGSNENHVQHQWVDEALLFRSHSKSPASGLIGIPMKSIEMRVLS